MKRADLNELCRYTRWCANEIGLRDWMLTVEAGEKCPYEPSAREQRGEAIPNGVVVAVPGAKRAEIWFSNALRHYKPIEVARIVVHELVHLHFTDLREFPRQYLFTRMKQPEYDAFMFGFDLAWEHAVEAIAFDWCRKLPPIQWPKAKKRK